MIMGLVLIAFASLLFCIGFVQDDLRWMLVATFLVVWNRALHDIDRED